MENEHFNSSSLERKTVDQWTEQNPERTYLLSVANYFVCCKDEKFFDFWDKWQMLHIKF